MLDPFSARPQRAAPSRLPAKVRRSTTVAADDLTLSQAPTSPYAEVQTVATVCPILAGRRAQTDLRPAAPHPGPNPPVEPSADVVRLDAEGDAASADCPGESRMTDVSVVGLGRMGHAMAEELAAAGCSVTVFNRTAERARDLAAHERVEVADTARAAAAAADVVLTSLADDEALRAVCDGPDGVLAGLRAGAVLVETSTVAPETMSWVAQAAAERDAQVLDAPVSGSVPSIHGHQLVVLAGGDAAALERARPVLEVFSRQVIHLGDVGAGAVTKLAVNAVVHALNAAVSEALVLCERAGVDRAAAYDALAASAAGAPFVQYKRDAFLDPDATPTAFALDLVAKDLRLAVALADRLGTPLPQAGYDLAIVTAAVDAGHGERDMSHLAEHHRRG